MKTFVINFPNDTIRKRFQQRQLSGRNYTFIEGIDGYTLDYSKIKINQDKQLFRKLKKGEIGCLMAHLKCYKKALELKLNKILILEDDAELNENFYSNMKISLENIPTDWDIIKLTSTKVWRKYKDRVSKTTKINDYCSSIEGDHYGTQGYIINSDAMKTLLNYHVDNPLTYPSDNLLTKFNLKVYLLNEDLLKIHRGFGSYTMNKDRYNKLELINKIDAMEIED